MSEYRAYSSHAETSNWMFLIARRLRLNKFTRCEDCVSQHKQRFLLILLSSPWTYINCRLHASPLYFRKVDCKHIPLLLRLPPGAAYLRLCSSCCNCCCCCGSQSTLCATDQRCRLLTAHRVSLSVDWLVVPGCLMQLTDRPPAGNRGRGSESLRTRNCDTLAYQRSPTTAQQSRAATGGRQGKKCFEVIFQFKRFLHLT